MTPERPDRFRFLASAVLARRLRGRPGVARRYLALEARRLLPALAGLRPAWR